MMDQPYDNQQFQIQQQDLNLQIQQNQYGANNQQQLDDQDNPDQKGFQKRLKEQDQIFALKKVELPGMGRNQQIKKIYTSQQSKIVVTKNNRLFRWRPNIQNEFRLIQVMETKQNFLTKRSGKQKIINIKKVYSDIKGIHTIICYDNGSNYYLHLRQAKVRLITKLKGYSIKSLAFTNHNKEQKGEMKTGEIIFSSQNGTISILYLELFEGQMLQNIDNSVLQLNTTLQIGAIQVIKLTQKNGKYAIILMATTTTLYCITGQDQISILFKKYQNSNQKIKQYSRISQPVKNTIYLKVCYSRISHRPINFIWINGKKCLIFKIPDKNLTVTDNIITRNQQLKFAKHQDVQDQQKSHDITEYPIAIGITDFNYYILYDECITIMSTITQKIVYKQYFKENLMNDMVYDQASGAFWVYQSKSIYKLDTNRQGSEAWKLFVADKRYREAYNVCQAKKQNLAYVAGLYADDIFQKKHYIRAGKLYTQTSRTIQQIFLKFLQANCPDAREGLVYYLYGWLDKLQPEQKTQRGLIISWLIQLFIYEINTIQKNRFKYRNQQSRIKLEQKQADLEKLLLNHLDVLNENLIYNMLASYGRTQNLIVFADKKKNYQTIINQFISEQAYDKCLQYLKSVKDINKIAQVVYKYSQFLFKRQPEKTVSLLIYEVKNFNPIRLMPGLMNIPQQKRSSSIQLLKYCVQVLKTKQKSLHNLFIYYYAKFNKQKIPQLVEIMKKDKLDFDLDFGLRLFRYYNIPEGQIIIYGKIKQYLKAITLSLENNKLQFAKQYAQKAEQLNQRKQLWMQIAKFYIANKSKPSQIINLIKQSKVLKVQDVLPFFSQHTKIQNFKQQICESLAYHSQEIERLNSLMSSYSSNADQLKSQMKFIKNRCIQLDSSNKCEQCFKTLFNTNFYMFPCLHGFHKECLFEAVKSQPTFPQKQIEKIKKLQQQIKQIKLKIDNKRLDQNRKQNNRLSFNSLNINLKSNLNSVMESARNILTSKKQQQITYFSLQRQENEIKTKREIIDSIMAAQCIYCGPGIVDTITMPFSNQKMKQSWKI